MTPEQVLHTIRSFSMGIVSTYHEAGSPSHEEVVALLIVNPDNPLDCMCWVGKEEFAARALDTALPGFERGQTILADYLKEVTHGPPQTLRVFIFCAEGTGAGYLFTTPRAQA